MSQEIVLEEDGKERYDILFPKERVNHGALFSEEKINHLRNKAITNYQQLWDKHCGYFAQCNLTIPFFAFSDIASGETYLRNLPEGVMCYYENFFNLENMAAELLNFWYRITDVVQEPPVEPLMTEHRSEP